MEKDIPYMGSGGCTKPPKGWYCVLAEGHRGSCPALPLPGTHRYSVAEPTHRATSRTELFEELHRRRCHQDDKFGGPRKDDQKILTDWLNLIHEQTTQAYRTRADARDENDHEALWRWSYRSQLIDVAATALAALESLERRWDELDG